MRKIKNRFAMKKIKLLALFIFILIPVITIGQIHTRGLFGVYHRDAAVKKVIGKYNFSVTYRFTYAIDTVTKHKYFDMHNLEVGDTFSRYYSTNADKVDSILLKEREYTKTHPHASKYDARGEYINRFDHSGWMQPSELERQEMFYQNYQQKGVVTCRILICRVDYEYTEPLGDFHWKIADSSSSIKVLGYGCQVATGNFRGRNYKVYFTEEIPVTCGPWKFNGLPGLILRVEESSGLFKWEAVGISQKPGDIYIHDPKAFPSKKSLLVVKKVSRKQVMNMQKLEWEDPLGLQQMHGETVADIYVDARVNPPKIVKITPGDRAKQFHSSYIPRLELE
jgi:GLPGLI family protein